MKLKLIALNFLIGSSLLQAGFFTNDKEHYDKHPKEAKSKVEMCNKAIEVALGKGDMKLAEKYDKDEECVNARKSYDEYMAKKREAEREAQKRKEAEERAKKAQEKAKKEAMYKAEYQKQLEIFKKYDYETFMKVGDKECSHYTGKLFSDNLTPKDAQCKAWDSLKKEKLKKYIDKIIAQYPGDKLVEYVKISCKNQGTPKYNYEKCQIAERALNKAVEKQKKYYLEHIDLLKKDFNDCHKKFAPLFLDNKFMKANKIENSFKCKSVKDAAMDKFNVYNLLHPLK